MSAYYDLYQSPPDENGESVCLHAPYPATGNNLRR